MKIATLALSCVLALALVHPEMIRAQGVPEARSGSWAAVRSLGAGEELAVVTIDGKTVKGRLGEASDTRLTLTRKGTTSQVDRADVLQVFRIASRSKKKGALIGFAVGAGTGAGAGGIFAAKHPQESGEAHLPAAIFGMIGAGLGTVAGLIFASRKKRVLIYEARAGRG